MDGLSSKTSLDGEQLATLALWAIPGLGPKALEAIGKLGPLAELLERPTTSWLGELHLNAPLRVRLGQVPSLLRLGETVLARAHAGGMRVVFPGQPLFPERLRTIPDAPPLLFVRGEACAPRKWVATVGSRKIDRSFEDYAFQLARELAQGGVGIVSGAAMGCDEACHEGAVAVGAPTWAFLGSALDEIDPGPRKLLPKILAAGGAFYSELPPGVRAAPETFPRRNRLISGSADVVLVLRAKRHSGTLHTALAAAEQGRPLLAMPGDPRNESAVGCNLLIQAGRARLCMGADDVFAELRMKGVAARPPSEQLHDSDLSGEARTALAALSREPRRFEDVMGACGLASGALTSALCELELMGLAIQHPGKLYEKV